MYRTQEAKAYQEMGAVLSRQAMRGRTRLAGSVGVMLNIQEPNRQHLADVDNAAKGILDGMRGPVYADDRQVDDLRVVRTIVSICDPLVEVLAWEMRPALPSLREALAAEVGG